MPSRSPSVEPRRTRNRRRIIVDSSEPSPELRRVQKLASYDSPKSLNANQTLTYSVTQSSRESTPEVIYAVTANNRNPAPFSKSARSGLAVRVSPRHIPGSQVWDYLSQSSVPYSAVRDEGPDAGIGESSTHLDTQRLVHEEQDFFVPDSQSLNQSSHPVPGSSKRYNGRSAPLETIHPVLGSEFVSDSLEPASRDRLTSRLDNSKIPRPTTSVPSSLTAETGNSVQNHASRSSVRPPRTRSVRFSQQHDHSTPSQKGADSFRSPIEVQTLRHFSGSQDPVQTSLQDFPASKKSGDSAWSLPASTFSSSSHSKFVFHQLQDSDLALQQDNLTDQDSNSFQCKAQISQSATNGQPKQSAHRNNSQISEAIRPQQVGFRSLPQRSKSSKVSALSSSSNLDFQTQVPFTSSSSQTSTAKARGKQPTSEHQNQVNSSLEDSSNGIRPATSPKQNAGSSASSQAQKFLAPNHKSHSALESHSSTSKFQTQVLLGLGSPAYSSPTTNHNLRSTKKSRLADSSASHISPKLLAKSEELAQSTGESFRFRDSSILSERDPNSQPEKLLHSAQERDEICIPSIETAEPAFEKLDYSIPHSLGLGNPSPVDNMAENGETAISPPVQMPALHATTPTSERSSVPFRERLRNMRAESAARLMANNIELSPLPMQPSFDISKPAHASVEEDYLPPRGTYRSPSVIPKPVPIEPVGDSRLEIQTIEDPISGGASQEAPLVPEPTSRVESLMRFSQQDIAQALKAPKIGPMEFVVPLPAPARVRDQYVAIINSYQKVIQAIVNEEATDSSTIERAQEFLENVENLSIHLDLVDSTTSTQQDVPPAAEALWASNCSFKFQFLQYLVQYSRRDDMHIVIVAKEGRLMDLIETFLKGLSAAYNRPDAMSSSKGSLGDNLRISLVTSKEGESTELLPAANLVVAFDSTFDATNKLIQEVRSHLLNVGQLAPVVHLIIYSSPEHISRCLPSSFNKVQRLRVMISCVTYTREEFGTILPEENIPEANAEEVAAFMKAGAGSPWLIVPIRPVDIQGLEFEFQDTQPLTQVTKDDRPPAKAKRALVCYTTLAPIHAVVVVWHIVY